MESTPARIFKSEGQARDTEERGAQETLTKVRSQKRVMKKFLQQLFSESGEASFSRLGAFVALGFACGWITYLALHIHVLPSLEGIPLFLAALYGLGKANQTLQRLMGSK
jgi:hypothetical protein